MTKNNCEVIRRELDELTLDEAWSERATRHLETCPSCRQFQEEQIKLRRMVGSLGTVAAPADFDFRLRARLANGSGRSVFHLRSSDSSFLRGAFAGVAMLLVFATGIVVVRNMISSPQIPTEVAERTQPPLPEPKPAAGVGVEAPNSSETAAVNPKEGSKVYKKDRVATSGSTGRRPLESQDFSNDQAPVINGSQAFGSSHAPAIFPIDASMQSLRVSLDDGRGNARTISVPTISFGSQRMMTNANQFAQKGVW